MGAGFRPRRRASVNLPNWLTVGRIAFTPLLVWLPLQEDPGYRLAAFVLYLAVAVTDYYDGMLARSRGLVTDLGKLLDPLADKLLLVGTFVPMFWLQAPVSDPMLHAFEGMSAVRDVLSHYPFVISLGGVVTLEAVRVGSFDIDAAIQAYVKREHGIAIGERTAEQVKIRIGSASPMADETQAEVRGRDLMTGLPKTVVLTPEEIRFAIEDVVSSIIASVVRCLAKAPPEMSQDFLERGMHLVGGGGLLNGLAQRIEHETRVPVMMSDMPLEAVVMGAGHCIEHYDALKNMFMGSRRP